MYSNLWFFERNKRTWACVIIIISLWTSFQLFLTGFFSDFEIRDFWRIYSRVFFGRTRFMGKLVEKTSILGVAKVNIVDFFNLNSRLSFFSSLKRQFYKVVKVLWGARSCKLNSAARIFVGPNLQSSVLQRSEN